ncbi:MAG: hypothetical protein HY922_13675 [Elusimicrobia bacterium]|nr:hypothetical protein [Elusimicrobiota bacterium]
MKTLRVLENLSKKAILAALIFSCAVFAWRQGAAVAASTRGMLSQASIEAVLARMDIQAKNYFGVR